MTEPERLASDKKLEEDKAYWAELQRSADAAMDPGVQAYPPRRRRGA